MPAWSRPGLDWSRVGWQIDFYHVKNLMTVFQAMSPLSICRYVERLLVQSRNHPVAESSPEAVNARRQITLPKLGQESQDVIL